MPSPNKNKITVVFDPELLEEIINFGTERDISKSAAVSGLAKKGLEVFRSEGGGFLSAEAVALAEIFDKLDDQGQEFLKLAADVMLERAQALERVEGLEKPAANRIKVAARNNPGGPIPEEDIIPFMAEQVQQSDEEL